MYSGFDNGVLTPGVLPLNSIEQPTSAGKTIYVSNSTELAAAIRGAKGGETIVAAAGTYEPIGLRGVNPASNVTITSADPSAKAVLTGLNLRDSSNITFRGVDLYDRDGSTANDFMVQSSKNVVFDQIKLSSNDIAKGNPFLIRWSENVTISNSEFTNVRYAINLLENNGVKIDNNYFHDIRGDGVRGGANSNIAITDNYFTNFRPTSGDHADAIQFWTSNTKASASNITVTGNIVMRGDGGAIQGIFMNDEVGNLPYKNVLIQDNLVVGGMFNGIRVANGVDVKVIGNTVTGMPGQLSWISVPKTAVLQGNSAQHYTIGGVSTDFPKNNEMIAAVRDGGQYVLATWLGLHLGIDPSKLVGRDGPAAVAPAPAIVIEGTAKNDTLRAAKAEDSILRGGEGNDLLYGQLLVSKVFTILEGGNGDDTYYVNTDRDTVVEFANGGNDTVITSIDYMLTDNVENLRFTMSDLTGVGNALNNRMTGTEGEDTFYGEGGNDTLMGLGGDDFLYGGDGNDGLSGGDGNDFLSGDAGNDSLNGGAGDDWLDGGDGDDTLEGGAGNDVMTGGAGKDTFIFRQADLGSKDIITDYNPAEDAKISLSLIDANTTTAANDAFKFIGTAAFSGKAGELKYTMIDGGILVEGDVNGDRVADLSIQFDGLTSISANNFML